MKTKMFVAALAAIALSACSSNDTFVEENYVSGTAEGLVPVSLGLGRSVATVAKTRGTGTVGDTATAVNAWHYEPLRVLMMQIPGTAENWNQFEYTSVGALGAQFDNSFVCVPTTLNSGTTGNGSGVVLDYLSYTEGKMKYYPMTGTSEFYAYYIDDAAVNIATVETVDQPRLDTLFAEDGITKTGLSTDFQINGTQDLMAGKATNYGGGETRGFSARSARSGIIPNIIMEHLLTRLTFTVQAGHINANGIRVTAIKVASPDKGTMTVAYNEAEAKDASELIAWNVDADDYTPVASDTAVFTLMQKQSPFYDDGTKTKKNLEALDTYTFTFTSEDPMAPTAADTTAFLDAKNILGDAIFVKPGMTAIPLTVTVQYDHQIGYEEDGVTPTLSAETTDIPLTIYLYDNEHNAQPLEIGKSYAINIKVYGYSEIEVQATLEAWEDGGLIDIDIADPYAE